MKPRHLFPLLIVLCLITACTAPAAAPTVTLPLTAAPTGTTTAAPTATAIPPTLTPTILPTVTPSPTPASLQSLAEGNAMWVFFEKASEFQIFNVRTGVVHTTLDVPEECSSPILLSLSMPTLLCMFGPQLYLYNPYTRQCDLIIENRDVFPDNLYLDAGRTGYQLAYIVQNADASTGSVYLYNIATRTEVLFAQNVALDPDYYPWPRPSADGKYVTFHQQDGYLAAVQKSGEMIRISPEGLIVDEFGDGTWSPVAPLIAYGVSDEEGYTGYIPPQYVNVTNVETGKTWRLEPGASYYYPNAPVWSPDGKEIAFTVSGGTGQEVCIFSSDDFQLKTCISLIIDIGYADFTAGWLEWSPDKQKIAFIARGFTPDDFGFPIDNKYGPANVMILDLETQKIVALTSGEEISWLWWR